MDNKNELINELEKRRNTDKVNNNTMEFFEESNVRKLNLSLPPAPMALYLKKYELCESLLTRGYEFKLNKKCSIFCKVDYEYAERDITPGHLLLADPLIPKRLLWLIYEKNKHVKQKLKLSTHYLENMLLSLKNGFYSEEGIGAIQNIGSNCFKLIQNMIVGEESNMILPGDSIEEYNRFINLMYGFFCTNKQNMDVLLEIFPDPMYVANNSFVMFRNRQVTLDYLKKEENYANIYVSLDKYFHRDQASEIKYCVSLIARMAALVGFYRTDRQSLDCRKRAFEIADIYRIQIREKWGTVFAPDKSKLYSLMMEEFASSKVLQRGLTAAFLSIFRTVLNMEVVLDVSNEQVYSNLIKVIENDPEEFDAALFEIKEFINVDTLEKWEKLGIYNPLIETRNEEIIRQSILKKLIDTDMLDICILKAKNKGYLELIPCMIAYRNNLKAKA